MSDLTYAFALDSGKYAKLAYDLLQSLKANTNASANTIIVYAIEDNIDKIPDHIINEFESNTTVIYGSYPNNDYKLSATHAALYEASKRTPNNEYILQLDTDTVVLDEITVHEQSDADLYLVPEVYPYNFWSDINESYDAWKNLYDEYGFTFPKDKRVKCPLNDTAMLPYYHSAAILTRANEFPKKWMDLAYEVQGSLREENYMSEMVALALLTSDYNVETLPESYSYLPVLHTTVPENVKILHYKRTNELYRTLLVNRNLRKRLTDTSIMEEFESQKGLNMYLKSIDSLSWAWANKTPNDEFPTMSLSGYAKTFIKKTNTGWIPKSIRDRVNF